MSIALKLWKLFTSTLTGILLVLVSWCVFVVLVFLAAFQFTLACAEVLFDYYKTILAEEK